MKTCTKCKLQVELVRFSKDKHNPDGFKSWCKLCCAAFRKRTNASRSAYNALWRANNRQRYNSLLSSWRRAHKYLDRSLKGKRRALKVLATPKWLSDKDIASINEIYKNCPVGYEVDHIIPLQGNGVVGLHVPWNLQYLTKADNIKKGNKYV